MLPVRRANQAPGLIPKLQADKDNHPQALSHLSGSRATRKFQTTLYTTLWLSCPSEDDDWTKEPDAQHKNGP
jgi:hypothetical protein